MAYAGRRLTRPAGTSRGPDRPARPPGATGFGQSGGRCQCPGRPVTPCGTAGRRRGRPDPPRRRAQIVPPLCLGMARAWPDCRAHGVRRTLTDRRRDSAHRVHGRAPRGARPKASGGRRSRPASNTVRTVRFRVVRLRVARLRVVRFRTVRLGTVRLRAAPAAAPRPERATPSPGAHGHGAPARSGRATVDRAATRHRGPCGHAHLGAAGAGTAAVWRIRPGFRKVSPLSRGTGEPESGSGDDGD